MTRSDRDERHSLAFFRGFLRKPEVVGSVIPSSRFLERRVVASCELGEARCVVELGPGTGGTTRALLAAMPSQAHLLAVEVEADFVEVLAQHEDPRLIARQGSAEAIAELLADNGLPAADVVVSGIPFSTIGEEAGRAVIDAVWGSLAPGGRFVAYQFRDRVAQVARPRMGEPIAARELLNIPPMHVYCWRKPAAEASPANAA
ncbi:class I SAM-dependent methyltransferase [Algiphilus aromaticivorans]|jgi:phospholipid N-methyltransferase|uniref:class I SAM-dependent methyltransferase n=1 Tax=Algiphilus aromaticivorans TaxID=382454 RepID=UPI0005C16AAC|nr:methyltransferase [Algiphilus aromaticivorans]